MAVQARHLSHDLAPASGRSLFLDGYAGCVPAPPRIGNATTTVLSDLACCNYGFRPTKRPRHEAEAGLAGPPPTGGGDLLEDQRVGTPPACPDRLLLPAPPFVHDVRIRAVGSGATVCTSGRVANGAATGVVSRELLSSWTHLHGVEIDALVALEAERMCAALEEAGRRHARALVSAVVRAASGRLRSSETDLQRALRRNAELEEKARQAAAECEAWMGVARSHEAVATGLRAALDQLLEAPCGAPAGGASGGEAEDARSCCFEARPPAAAHQATEDDGGACASSRSMLACKSCGSGGEEACVLLLPCRHLCLCLSCEAAVDTCPICSATKNGSLHVLFS